MNEIIKFSSGVFAVVIASYSQNNFLLPLIFILYSILIIDYKDNKSSHKMLSILFAMSLIDRYDLSYGILNIFYVSLAFFLTKELWVSYFRNLSINIFWLSVSMICISIILLIGVRTSINIEDAFKWILLICLPMMILAIEYRVNIHKFFLYLKDINIFIIGIGLGQIFAVFGFIPLSNAVGLDMEYHVVRPTGLSSEPTWFSQQLALLLGITIFSGVKLSKAYFLICMISLFIIFVCFTRGAYLILIILAIFLIVRNLNQLFHKPILSIALSLIILMLVFAAVPYIDDTKILTNTINKFLLQDASAGARFEGVFKTINYWLQNPIVGHGFTYNNLMVTSEGTAINQKIFNSFLGALATGGIVLYLIYLSILGYLLLRSFDVYLNIQNYLPIFLAISYILLSSVMPFAYSFFGIFVTMLITIILQKNINKEPMQNEM